MVVDKKRQLQVNFRAIVLDCIHMLKLMDLDPSEIVEKNVFPKTPFFRGAEARAFFLAVQDNDIKTTEAYINFDRFIVYEHDHMEMTALHWAAKRNHFEIIKLLIDRHAQVNKQDYLGRTALFLAAENNYLKSCKALLVGRAKPNIRSGQGLSSIDVCTDWQISGFLKKAFLLHICLPLVPMKKRGQVWENEGLTYFRSEDDSLTVADFPK